jgi:hypothetical protein
VNFFADRRLGFVNLAVKAALVLLLLHAVVFPDLEQYAGKGIAVRLISYPISIIVVPLILWTLGHRRTSQYPHLIDISAAAPFVLDTLGNTLNLYNSIDWFDDVMHFVTWVPWVAGFGLALRYNRGLPRWNVFGLALGYGAVTHILWELGEYFAFIRSNPDEFSTAYEDTLGDLASSLAGSVVGAALVITVLWRLGTVRDPEVD